MGSDRSVLARARGLSGLKNSAKWSEEFIESEVQTGKEELSKEIEARLNNGETINFYDNESAVKALEHFVALRLMAHSKGEKVPQTFSSARPSGFSNPDVAEQASKANHYMGEVFE